MFIPFKGADVCFRVSDWDFAHFGERFIRQYFTAGHWKNQGIAIEFPGTASASAH
jgi:hypothetical protein